MTINEPQVITLEKEFEAAIIHAVHDILRRSQRPYAVVPKFGLDIGVFVGHESTFYPRFVEAKSFAGQRQGGVGFGNNRGEGPQATILLGPEGYFSVVDACVRWVLVDATRPAGTPRYALFDCSTAKAAAMGGVARGKQNNLRLSAFAAKFVTWPALLVDLETFLCP